MMLGGENPCGHVVKQSYRMFCPCLMWCRERARVDGKFRYTKAPLYCKRTLNVTNCAKGLYTLSILTGYWERKLVFVKSWWIHGIRLRNISRHTKCFETYQPKSHILARGF